MDDDLTEIAEQLACLMQHKAEQIYFKAQRDYDEKLFHLKEEIRLNGEKWMKHLNLNPMHKTHFLCDNCRWYRIKNSKLTNDLIDLKKSRPDSSKLFYDSDNLYADPAFIKKFLEGNFE